MEKYTQFTGIVAPLDRANVDTDLIIPKQFLKSIKRTGFGPNLFDELRYLDEGQPGQDSSQRPLNKDFVLNLPRYKGAQVLLARRNFGCGSSREHAAWALLDLGIKAVIAPSFSDIFSGNAFKNGILTVVMPQEQVDRLMEVAQTDPITIDLEAQTVTTPFQDRFSFEIDPFRKHCLLDGLDEVGLTLARDAAITAYENKGQAELPWLAKGTGAIAA